jgi:prepilin peptidase CpaA
MLVCFWGVWKSDFAREVDHDNGPEGSEMIGTVIFVVAVALYTAIAAVVDFRIHRIPNYVTVPAAVLGLAYHTLAPCGWGPLMSLAGLAVGFALLLLPWLMSGAGMGDVKLLAALGAWLGPWNMLIAFALSAGLGTAIVLGILLRDVMNEGVIKAQKKHMASRRPKRKGPKRALPFAVPLALSTWGLLVWLVSRGGI